MTSIYAPAGTRVERISDRAAGTLVAVYDSADESGDAVVVVRLDSGAEIAGSPWAFRKSDWGL